jgi:hypothetical protein
VACAVTAANVNDTVLFGPLFLAATGVMARIAKVFADKDYHYLGSSGARLWSEPMLAARANK